MNIAKPIQRLLKPIALTSTLIALTACGGGGGGGDDAVCDDTPPSLFDITGVWDISSAVGQEFDERYMNISIYSNPPASIELSSRGRILDYDYLGDSFDQGPDCYRTANDDEILDLGNGEFVIIDGDGRELFFSANFCGSTLVWVLADGKIVTQTRPSPKLGPSDLRPLCG